MALLMVSVTAVPAHSIRRGVRPSTPPAAVSQQLLPGGFQPLQASFGPKSSGTAHTARVEHPLRRTQQKAAPDTVTLLRADVSGSAQVSGGGTEVVLSIPLNTYFSFSVDVPDGARVGGGFRAFVVDATNRDRLLGGDLSRLSYVSSMSCLPPVDGTPVYSCPVSHGYLSNNLLTWGYAYVVVQALGTYTLSVAVSTPSSYAAYDLRGCTSTVSLRATTVTRPAVAIYAMQASMLQRFVDVEGHFGFHDQSCFASTLDGDPPQPCNRDVTQPTNVEFFVMENSLLGESPVSSVTVLCGELGDDDDGDDGHGGGDGGADDRRRRRRLADGYQIAPLLGNRAPGVAVLGNRDVEQDGLSLSSVTGALCELRWFLCVCLWFTELRFVDTTPPPSCAPPQRCCCSASFSGAVASGWLWRA